MTTPDPQLSVSGVQPTLASTDLTVGWFVKRSVLWLLIVACGVGMACLLYAAAGSAESRIESEVAAEGTD